MTCVASVSLELLEQRYFEEKDFRLILPLSHAAIESNTSKLRKFTPSFSLCSEIL